MKVSNNSICKSNRRKNAWSEL